MIITLHTSINNYACFIYDKTNVDNQCISKYELYTLCYHV